MFRQPYRQHNYIGEFDSDASADTFLSTVEWTEKTGLFYLNTVSAQFRKHNGSGWEPLAPLAFYNETASTDSWNGNSWRDLSGLTLNPHASVYLAVFSGRFRAGSSNANFRLRINVGGVATSVFQARVIRYSQDIKTFSLQITVANDGDAVTPQWRILSGGTVRCTTRSFQLVEVASA